MAFERSQLLSIFDGIDDMVYVTDPYTYEVLYANKAMKEKFGSGLVGGICYREFQRRDSTCDFCTNSIILKEKGKPYHWEYYNPSVDRYFMITDRIIKWPDCRDVRFEIAKDITESNQAEEALRLSNLYNRSLIEASLDPLVTIGPDGKITDVNGATEEVTGYSRNDLIGTDFSDYFTEPEKARKGYKQAFTDGEVRDYPLEIQHKDGHITPVLYNASVYRDKNGEVIGVFAAARDITEIKKAEKALSKNLAMLAKSQEIAHLGSWSLDFDTGEFEASDEDYRIYGLVPGTVAVMDMIWSMIHPADLERYREYVESVQREGGLGGIDYRIMWPDGSVHYVHAMTDSVVRAPDGRVKMASGIIQDITERKKAEEALKKAHDNLEEKVKERTAELETAYNSLKESERGFAEAQKMAHIGNWDNDLVIGELHWSEEMYRIFGRHPQEA